MMIKIPRTCACILSIAAVAACSSGGGGSGDSASGGEPPETGESSFELTLESAKIEHFSTAEPLTVEGLPATGNTVRVESQNSK